MFARTSSGSVSDVVPGHDRAAARRLQDRAQDPQRRRLARAVGPSSPKIAPGRHSNEMSVTAVIQPR